MGSTAKITRYRDTSLLLVEAQLKGNTTYRLSHLPAWSKWIGRKLLFKPDAANIEYIDKEFPEAEWCPGLPKKFYKAHLKQIAERSELQEAKSRTFTPDKTYEYKRRPCLLYTSPSPRDS